MNNKRQLCRTQGKYSSETEVNQNKSSLSRQRFPKNEETQKRHKEKISHYDSEYKITSHNKYEKNNTARHGSLFNYQESSQHEDIPGAAYEIPKSVKVINTPGRHDLGQSTNGPSFFYLIPNVIGSEEGYELMNCLRKETEWLNKKIIIDGQEYSQPRLVAWYGPLSYSYSGAVLKPKEFSSVILCIKNRIEEKLKKSDIKVELNSVLLNLYRNGKDSVAWHSDDELSMGVKPTIVSLSLGETRRFEIRKKNMDKSQNSPADYCINLEHGSLLIMDGAMQQDWQHRVPKEFHDKSERINLTFRTVFPIKSSSQTLLTKEFVPTPTSKDNDSIKESFELTPDAFPTLGESLLPESKLFPKKDSEKSKIEIHENSKSSKQFEENLFELSSSNLLNTKKSDKEENYDISQISNTESVESSVCDSESKSHNPNSWNNVENIKPFIPKFFNERRI